MANNLYDAIVQRVSEVLACTQYAKSFHIEIDADMDNAPAIKYNVEEAIVYSPNDVPQDIPEFNENIEEICE